MKLKDLYPDYDIVCKINYQNEWQGSAICEDLAEDRVIYTGHIISPNIKEAVEWSGDGFLKMGEITKKKKLKVKRIISDCIERKKKLKVLGL